MSAHLTLVVDHRSASAAEPQKKKESVEAGDAPTAADSSRSDAAHGVAEISHPAEPDDTSWVHAAWVPRPPLLTSVIRRIEAAAGNGREALRGEESERGAVTAEYAIVILAGVAFAGVLVAIMRSGEIRQMLVDLVQNALGSAG